MSEREEYTPTMDEIKGWYAGVVDKGEAAFDRAIAAHERAIREQIARSKAVTTLESQLDLILPPASPEGR